MATRLNLDSETEQAMDELLGLGSFDSKEHLVREALKLVRMREGFDPSVDAGEVEEHTRAAVERGVADAKAGRVRPVADVFRDLRERYQSRT